MSQAQDYRAYFGYVGPEFLRVIRLMSRARKEQVYAALHVAAGSRILDIGCGPGADTIALAQLIGPTGYVVGLDQDAAMLAEADARATEAGVGGWVEHRLGDAEAMPFPADHFDACHSERLFLHLAHPEVVLGQAAAQRLRRAEALSPLQAAPSGRCFSGCPGCPFSQPHSHALFHPHGSHRAGGIGRWRGHSRGTRALSRQPGTGERYGELFLHGKPDDRHWS